MLDIVSKGFKSAKELLQGKATLSEDNISEALAAIRTSLLEADVEYGVVKTFIGRVKDKAVGEIVSVRVKHEGEKIRVSPGDHFIKICQDELIGLMGPVDTSLSFSSAGPTGVMMVGLQGAGKTTTTGKLANYLKKQKMKPLLVAADVYRPAAIEQLKVLGRRLDVQVYSEDSKDPVGICSRAMELARRERFDVVLFDTAGRLAVDEELMNELERISKETRAQNILLVCDAMIGQDAVNTAKEFDRRLQLSGFILTKLDGDTRGGAALSIKEVTGRPIKFLGMGEDLEKLEEFRPDGLASRILGFGDIVGLVKDFERVVDQKESEEDAMRMLQGRFTLDDFVNQIRTIKKMGSLQDIFEKLPFFSGGLPEGMNLDDGELDKIVAMIQSMTKQERQRPDIINPSRLQRIAKGSGKPVNDVRSLLQRFFQMRKMMGKLGSGMGILDKIPGFKQMKQLRNFGNMAFDDMVGELGEARKKINTRPVLTAEDKRKERNKKKQAAKSKKQNRKK